MNLLRGLYFPGTGPKKELFSSLRCLFDRIDFYRITEDDAADGVDGGGTDGWEGRVVLPLGDDRERFLAMVSDIRAHAGEYYEGFLAALSGQSQVDRDESSVWRLVASLHGEQSGSGEEKALIEKQWQARLVLKLAEIVAEEEDELDRELANFRQKERAVFNSLKGELEGPAEVAGIFDSSGSVAGGRSGSARSRWLLAAWGVLFACDPRRHDLLFTDNEDAASALLNTWEKVSSDQSQLLAELEIPGLGTNSELESAGSAIAGALNSLVSGERSGRPEELATAVEQWHQRSGEIGGDRLLLSIHLLQGSSLDSLWCRISGTAATESSGDRLLVGVLRPLF